jgi:hypothetical protein
VSEARDPGIELLEQIRDLLREDLRLRQTALEEQRAYQATAQANLKRMAGKQRFWSILLLGAVGLWLAMNFLAPFLFAVFGRGLRTGGAGGALVPSRVDTAAFDGRYALLAEPSFAALRDKARTEQDPKRRLTLETLLQWQAEQYGDFRIHRGVIRSGTRLVQEFSLTHADVQGNTLRGKALWHEDVGDPGDATEVPVSLRLQGDTLEFAMQGDDGQPGDTVYLKKGAPPGR